MPRAGRGAEADQVQQLRPCEENSDQCGDEKEQWQLILPPDQTGQKNDQNSVHLFTPAEVRGRVFSTIFCEEYAKALDQSMKSSRTSDPAIATPMGCRVWRISSESS